MVPKQQIATMNADRNGKTIFLLLIFLITKHWENIGALSIICPFPKHSIMFVLSFKVSPLSEHIDCHKIPTTKEWKEHISYKLRRARLSVRH